MLTTQDKVQIFPVTDFLWLFYKFVCNKSRVFFCFFFVFLFFLPNLNSFTNEELKMWAHDVRNTCGTRAGLVRDVTDTDCQTQLMAAQL